MVKHDGSTFGDARASRDAAHVDLRKRMGLESRGKIGLEKRHAGCHRHTRHRGFGPEVTVALDLASFPLLFKSQGLTERLYCLAF